MLAHEIRDELLRCGLVRLTLIDSPVDIRDLEPDDQISYFPGEPLPGEGCILGRMFVVVDPRARRVEYHRYNLPPVQAEIRLPLVGGGNLTLHFDYWEEKPQSGARVQFEPVRSISIRRPSVAEPVEEKFERVRALPDGD